MTVLQETLDMYVNGQISKDSVIEILRKFDLKKWEIEEINKVFKFEYK